MKNNKGYTTEYSYSDFKIIRVEISTLSSIVSHHFTSYLRHKAYSTEVSR